MKSAHYPSNRSIILPEIMKILTQFNCYNEHLAEALADGILRAQAKRRKEIIGEE